MFYENELTIKIDENDLFGNALALAESATVMTEQSMNFFS